MYRLFTAFLHRFPPEVAHAIAITALKCRQWMFYRLLGRRLTRRVAISVSGKISFANRLGLAAGFDKNAEAFAALASLGFGFVEVGTVTPEPQAGNPKPRLFRPEPGALVNRMGFNNCGLTAFRENIRRYRASVPGVGLMANLGKGRATPVEAALGDYRAGFEKLADSVDGFVVNLSSPNTPGLRALQNDSFLESIAGVAPVGMPVWVKFAPDLSNEELTAVLEKVKRLSPLSGVVLTNTSRQLAEKGYPEGGGWSGPQLLPRSLECVRLARQILGSEKTVVGVGGVSSIADYHAMLQAGADLVEIYTAFVYQGPPLIKRLTHE